MDNMFKEIDGLLDIYKFSDSEKEEFLSIIKPIVMHPEFIKRMNSSVYAHHGSVSLGSHIIRDAALTYKICKKKILKNKHINLRIAIIIAMFHDLYEMPWQNVKSKKKMFSNKHGFVHPIEAVINAVTWYPEYFKDEEEALIIIDGIIHHMYPFPVRSINKDIEDIESNVTKKFYELDKKYRELIILSTLRRRIGSVSIYNGKYVEGKIMSRADKMVALGKQEVSFSSLKACITGVNKKLEKKKRD